MGDSRVFSEPLPRSRAGTITKIRMENFMCHSSLEIELGDYVNFITGQNGSGKSAILTALCVAFGCRASGTQRASTLKQFIKNGFSSAVIQVELKNHGEDAFRPDIYGDTIIIERRISESTSSTILKDHHGRKVASRKEELRELVEHFNIDVENPCVVMSQDKSREFLHSGNSKDKFKFFFKATLLQQVSELLQSIREQLKSAEAFIEELEDGIGPILKELDELLRKIKNMERLEGISEQVKQLKKKLAWANVYDIDRELQQLHEKIGKLKERIPACQAKIDQQTDLLDILRHQCTEKKTQVNQLMVETANVKKRKAELQERLSSAKRRRQELGEDHHRDTEDIKRLRKRVTSVQQLIHELKEQELKNTQEKEFQIKAEVKELEGEVNTLKDEVTRMKEDESNLLQNIQNRKTESQEIAKEIDELEKNHRKICSEIKDLRQNQSNKITAFGGDKVINLLRKIEERQNHFEVPPVGPIGAHVTLVNSQWAPAVENAIGKLLNAFIVTNHRDSLVLKKCAKDVHYYNIQIFIYDFSRPRLSIPPHMLAQTDHPTILKVIKSENATVLNVLVDMGNIERQVLVENYDVGKKVAFDRRISNVKEVFTLDGFRMFSRGSVQTILPPNKYSGPPRLCNSFEGQIEDRVQKAKKKEEEVNSRKSRKRDADSALSQLKNDLDDLKRRRVRVEHQLVTKEYTLKDLKSTYEAEARLPISNVDVHYQEISQLEAQMQEKGKGLQNLEVMIKEADEKANNLILQFKDLCESAKGEISALECAEEELVEIENKIRTAETKKVHYEGIMEMKVLNDINVAEANYQKLEHTRNENSRKASIICDESEIQALGEWDGSTAEQLTAQLERLNRRLQQESQQYSESIDDLRMIYENEQRKISRKQESYKANREKLNALNRALDLRMDKFKRNATLLKRELTWKFNEHLNTKGVSGEIKVNYDEKTLSVEVKMPQDASSNAVRDTRGLSGGERSFSTLCFALALHGMIEAPFRAMDEFDVFMDAVTRKISLDNLIEFALMQGSQWIFITPLEISMVKPSDKVKKQQLAAPRS